MTAHTGSVNVNAGWYEVTYGGTWEQVIVTAAKGTIARSVRAYTDVVGPAAEL